MPDNLPAPSTSSDESAPPALPGDASPLNAPADSGGFQHAASDPELVRLWLAGKAENTRRAYRSDLEEFIDYVDKPIRAITLGDAQNFRRYLQKSATWSRRRSRANSGR